MPRPSRLSLARALALAIAAGAFAVRVYHLNSQSLWHDEGSSLFCASQDLPTLFSLVGQIGEVPPLYFLVLHFWLPLAGQSEFAVRFPSVVAAVLTIALLYQLGRRLGGSAVGLAATLFLAVAPIDVWQSQEARMYTLAVLLAVLATYLLVRSLRRPAAPWLVGYALVCAAGLYTHFTFALVLGGHVAFLALWLLGGLRRLRPAIPVGLSAGFAGVAFLPWLRLGIGTYEENATYWTGRLDVLATARDTLAAFLAGDYARPLDATTLALGGTALVALGLLAAALARRKGDADGPAPAALLLGAGLLLPAIGMAILLYDRPKFGTRYVLVLLPTFCLLAAWATTSLPVGLWRRFALGERPPGRDGRGARAQATLRASAGALGLLVGAACLVVGAWALVMQFTDPRFVREDYRGAAAYLAENTTADDAIILLGGHIQLPFLHYYREGPRPGQAAVYPLPDSILPVVRHPLQAEDVKALNAIVAGHKRVWVLRWQDQLADPAGVIMQQLELAGQRFDPGRAFAGLNLDAFTIAGNPTFPVTFRPQTPLAASFANGLTLLGFDLAPARARPGETLHLTLYWRVDGAVAGDYVAFTQLLNPADHIYAQHDKPPVSELYRTSQWAPGDMLRDQYELRVKAGTPPGQYHLLMGLYDRASMQRVAVRAGVNAEAADHLALAEVAIDQGEPTSAGSDEVRQHREVDVAPGMRLLGYEVEQDVLHAGETARVTLLWQSTAPVAEDRAVRLALQTTDGREVTATTGSPADGTYPTSRWRSGELVRDIHNLPLPPDLPAGSYTLAVSVPPGGAAPLGPLEVR